MPDFKPTLCIDMDGTIHAFFQRMARRHAIRRRHRWFLPGWAEQAAKQFKLVIYSSRSATDEGRAAMLAWLIEQRRA